MSWYAPLTQGPQASILQSWEAHDPQMVGAEKKRMDSTRMPCGVPSCRLRVLLFRLAGVRKTTDCGTRSKGKLQKDGNMVPVGQIPSWERMEGEAQVRGMEGPGSEVLSHLTLKQGGMEPTREPGSKAARWS